MAGRGEERDPAKRVERLGELLRRADHAYYVLDDPELTDAEYDALFRELTELEAESPELIRADSPTQRVSGAVASQFASVTHLAIDQVSIGNRRLEILVGPSPGLSLEQIIERYLEHLQHQPARFGRRVGVLSVHDIRPMPSRQTELDRPMVLGDTAPRDEFSQFLLFQANSHLGHSVGVIRREPAVGNARLQHGAMGTIRRGVPCVSLCSGKVFG